MPYYSQLPCGPLAPLVSEHPCVQHMPSFWPAALGPEQTHCHMVAYCCASLRGLTSRSACRFITWLCSGRRSMLSFLRAVLGPKPAQCPLVCRAALGRLTYREAIATCSVRVQAHAGTPSSIESRSPHSGLLPSARAGMMPRYKLLLGSPWVPS